MPWFHEKGISTLRLIENQSSSLKRDKLWSWQESSFFSRRPRQIGSSHWVKRYWCLFHKKSSLTLHFVGNESSSLNWDELCSLQESISFRDGHRQMCSPRVIGRIRGKNLVSFDDKHRQMGSSHLDTQYWCFGLGRSISTHCFVRIQRDELYSSQESSFFSRQT